MSYYLRKYIEKWKEENNLWFFQLPYDYFFCKVYIIFMKIFLSFQIFEFNMLMEKLILDVQGKNLFSDVW